MPPYEKTGVPTFLRIFYARSAMFYSSSRLQPTTDESRQSVQMSNHFTNRKSRTSVSIGAQRVLIAPTAMLAFISFWRAAAVVLNDMGSSAFYAGAMSGEETMAQVYREIEHPKLRNLEKAGFVIFLYSLIFTAGVAFFAVMIIPDSVRNNFSDNPIGGLSMYLVGPLSLRIAFRAFVAVVGPLMLAGAVNTSIVGSK